MPPWQNPVTKCHDFGFVPHTQKTKKAEESVTAEAVVYHSFHYPIHILMNANDPGTKSLYKTMYNPMPKVKTLLMMLAELNPGLTVMTLDWTSKLIARQDKFPATKEEFKKYFTCEWEANGSHQQNQIHLRCQINGNQTVSNIKHSFKPNKLLTWLAKEKVYLKADALGIRKTKTIGYLTHIHPQLVNCTCTHIKTQIHDMLEMTLISTADAMNHDWDQQRNYNTLPHIWSISNYNQDRIGKCTCGNRYYGSQVPSWKNCTPKRIFPMQHRDIETTQKKKIHTSSC